MTRPARTRRTATPADPTGPDRSAPDPVLALRSTYVTTARVATGRASSGRRDLTSLSVPNVLRDLIAASRQHPNQAYHEVVEAAMLHWLDGGGWGCGPCRGRMAHRVVPDEGSGPRIA